MMWILTCLFMIFVLAFFGWCLCRIAAWSDRVIEKSVEYPGYYPDGEPVEDIPAD